jgi:hypothetical protein
MARMSKPLMDAYAGVYEDELKPFNDRTRPAAIEALILADDAKKRLEVYLEWNGIIGYTNTIYMIATGAIG